MHDTIEFISFVSSLSLSLSLSLSSVGKGQVVLAGVFTVDLLNGKRERLMEHRV